MGSQGEIRLNGKIAFNPESEKYIADAIQDMCYHRSISDFLEILIKIAFDSPEMLSRKDELHKLINFMNDGGYTPLAENFYSKARKDIDDIKRKVNEIYDMCLSMYTLAKFGKALKLEQRTNNLVMAEFMLERQISQICQTMGINDYQKFNSGSYLDVDSKSEEILQYILEHYSNIVREVKTSTEEIEVKIPVIKVSKQIIELDMPSIVQNSSNNTIDETHKNNLNSDEAKDMLNVLDSGETIDFGNSESGEAYSSDRDISAAMQLLGF